MQRVVIIDYGSGNLHSAAKALERAAYGPRPRVRWLLRTLSRVGLSNFRVEVSNDPGKVLRADRVVLPGVGAFADCKRGLDAVPGMHDALEEAVRVKGRPFLGICVGMQLMATRGLEFETTDGFGWIAGDVRTILPKNPSLKIPHMGWNTLDVQTPHALLDGIKTGPDGLHAYFVHSFHLAAADRSVVVAETDYGGPVTAIVARDNMVGTQFHPEKSQTLGLKLLANFLKWRPS